MEGKNCINPTESQAKDHADEWWTLIQGNFSSYKSIFQNIWTSGRWSPWRATPMMWWKLGQGQPSFPCWLSCIVAGESALGESTLGRRINLSEPVCSSVQYEQCLLQGKLRVLAESKWEMKHDQTLNSTMISLSSHFLIFFLQHFLPCLPIPGSWNIFIVIENIIVFHRL